MSLLFSCLFAFLMYEIAAGCALAMTGKVAYVIASGTHCLFVIASEFTSVAISHCERIYERGNPLRVPCHCERVYERGNLSLRANLRAWQSPAWNTYSNCRFLMYEIAAGASALAMTCKPHYATHCLYFLWLGIIRKKILTKHFIFVIITLRHNRIPKNGCK